MWGDIGRYRQIGLGLGRYHPHQALRELRGCTRLELVSFRGCTRLTDQAVGFLMPMQAAARLIGLQAAARLIGLQAAAASSCPCRPQLAARLRARC